MPVTLISTPDLFALTKSGRMLYTFSGSGRFQTQGVQASCLLFLAYAVTAGTKLTLSWNGQSHTLTFRTTPIADDEFSIGNGGSAYVTALMAELQSYFPIRENFTLSLNDPNTLPGIIFTAKLPGAQYSISTTLPVGTPFGFGTTLTGADPIMRAQYSVYAEVWLQKVGTVGTDLTVDYERIFTPMIECDHDGMAQFDVGSVLHDKLTADYPDWNLPAPTIAQTSARRYYVCYGEAYGSPLQVGRVHTDAVKHVLLGGVDYVHRAGGGLNLLYAQTSDAADDKALRLGDTVRFVRPDEPQYLTFLNSRDDLTSALLLIIRTFDDDSVDPRLDQLSALAVSTGQKITYAVGPTQQDLLNILPAGRTLKEYSAQWVDADSNPLSSKYRFILNYDYQPYTRYFGYLNSLGSIDTLATFGKGSSELARFYEQAERYMPALYEIADGQFVDYNVTTQRTVEVATGFRSASELRGWDDFYRSPNRFRLSNDQALPIGITSKSIKQAKDGDTLFAHKFQYSYLFKDDFYSEDQTSSMDLPPLGFVGTGTVVIQPTMVVHAIDDTVPNAVRGLTATIINKFQQAFAWGNHALAGYLNQSTASMLFRRNDQPVPYADLSNTPTTRDQAGLTDVPTREEIFTLIHVQAHLTSWTGDDQPSEII